MNDNNGNIDHGWLNAALLDLEVTEKQQKLRRCKSLKRNWEFDTN